jgi:hypothetical protein
MHLYCTDTNTVSKQTEMRFHMTHSPRSSIGCAQLDFRADGTIYTNRVPFLHRDYHYLKTESNKLPLEPHHLGVSLGASKTISEPMVCLAQTGHLYCTNTNTVFEWIKTWLYMTDCPRSSIVASKTISLPMVRSAQTVHLYCTDTNTISKRTETSFHMTHSPRNCIGCVQDDFRSDGTFDKNHAPIWRQD